MMKRVEKLTGINILEDSSVVSFIFGMHAKHISGAYLCKGFSKLFPNESIILAPKKYDNKYSVLFHELTHATGIEGRLDRVGLTNGGTDYRNNVNVRRAEEQIAERTAMALMDFFKLSTPDTIKQSINYLQQNYVGSEAQVYVLKETDKAIQFILNNWLQDIIFCPVQQELSLMEKLKQFMKVF